MPGGLGQEQKVDDKSTFLICRHKRAWMSYGAATISRLLKIVFSLAEYRLFYRALLQKRPILLRSLLIVATPYVTILSYPQAKGSWRYMLWLTRQITSNLTSYERGRRIRQHFIGVSSLCNTILLRCSIHFRTHLRPMCHCVLVYSTVGVRVCILFMYVYVCKFFTQAFCALSEWACRT